MKTHFKANDGLKQLRNVQVYQGRHYTQGILQKSTGVGDQF